MPANLNLNLNPNAGSTSIPSGSDFAYLGDSHSASNTFNQQARSLFVNQPRFPFEYYISINLNNVGTAKTYISEFFNTSPSLQIAPLVKTVDMPSMKIETTPLNQYNRKRLSQTKIAYEPIKMVFHDVADGKTLKFWDMYYRYYFADGNEPGQNQPKNLTPSGLQNFNLPTPAPSATNTNGDKNAIQNIVSNTLDNHNFGYNLDTVQNVRNLIQSIDIFQVHGGRFNQVTLANPRISAFTHDVLNYATSDKTLELSFTIEYEYAYYTIQNMLLGGSESNNDSSLQQYAGSEFLELSTLGFTSVDPDFIQSNNPLLFGDNPLTFNPVNNVQVSLSSLSAGLTYSSSTSASASSISGLVNITPPPLFIPSTPVIQTRPFASTAPPVSANVYVDVNRTGNYP